LRTRKGLNLFLVLVLREKTPDPFIPSRIREWVTHIIEVRPRFVPGQINRAMLGNTRRLGRAGTCPRCRTLLIGATCTCRGLSSVKAATCLCVKVWACKGFEDPVWIRAAFRAVCVCYVDCVAGSTLGAMDLTL